MLLIIPLLILCLLAGFMLYQTLALRRRFVSNPNKCIECGDKVPDGFHLCMKCWSYQKIDKGF
jgi:hypothetical protein